MTNGDDSDACERAKEALSDVCGGSVDGGETDDPLFDESLPAVPVDWRPPDVKAVGLDRLEDVFDPDQTINPLRDGISGLWFPDANTMYVSPRRSHHNDQLAELDRLGTLNKLGDVFVPWVWDIVRIPDKPEQAEVDFPRSAGGAFQYVTRNDLDIEYVRSGDRMTEKDVYAVVWTCRLLDVPGESMARVSFLPSDSKYSPGSQLAVELGVKRTEDTPIENFYREVQFSGELPDPIVDRDIDVVVPE